MRRVPVETLPQEEHQALRAEAVKLANERVEFLRQHGNVQKLAGNSAAPRSAENTRPEENGNAFIKAESLPSNSALVTVPTAQPQGIDSHKAVEFAGPPCSSSTFAPEIFFGNDTTTTMSYSSFLAQDLTEEDLQNLASSSAASGPAMADLNDIAQPTNDQASVPDPQDWPPLDAVDPWANNAPATDPEEAKARFMFHAVRLNNMHEIRKQTNQQYMMSYLLQGQFAVETTTAYIGLQMGFNAANDIIGKYNATNDLRELLHLITHVRTMLIPKLDESGPIKMRNCLYAFARNINDPKYKLSFWNHVTAALYQMFCGVKGFMMLIDRHREQNPDPYKALPAFKFETHFTVTREQFWAWLAPGREDKDELGMYDHWFGN